MLKEIDAIVTDTKKIMIQLDNSDTRPPRCCALECRQCDAAIIGSSNLATQPTTNSSASVGGSRIYGEKFDMLISELIYRMSI